MLGPPLSTFLTALFLLAGASAVWSMLVMLGRRDRSSRIPYRIIHRVSGWAFFLLFLLLFLTMFGRLEDFWEESPPRVAIHFALAIGCLFLLLVKVAVARRFKGLAKHLFALGVGSYLLAFPMAVITGSYYVLRVLEGTPYISHASLPEMLDEELGKTLLMSRCTSCHLLADILRPYTREQWEEIITRMVALARPRIRPIEAKQILNYLVLNHRRPDPLPSGTTPFDRHCSPCHDRQELRGKRFDREGWEAVVRRMHDRDRDLVPLEKMPEIVDYMMKFQEGKVQEDHPGER
jgi:hypothetical protein